MNHVVLRGNIRSELEKRNIGNEPYVAFTIDVECKNRYSGKVERDCMHCEAWSQTAESICRQFGKGDNIVVIGELRTKGYAETKFLPRIVVSEACFTAGSLIRPERR